MATVTFTTTLNGVIVSKKEVEMNEDALLRMRETFRKIDESKKKLIEKMNEFLDEKIKSMKK